MKGIKNTIKKHQSLKQLAVTLLLMLTSVSNLLLNPIKVEAATTYSYGFTGDVQTWTCPEEGTYKIEIWGARGGNGGNGAGGYGGYSTITVKANQGDSLYIYVGGGGYGNMYNGGGVSTNGGDGGGATHIAITARGELKNYASHTSEVLLVAGGGGGGARDTTSADVNTDGWREIPSGSGTMYEVKNIAHNGGDGGGMTGGNGEGCSAPAKGGGQTYDTSEVAHYSINKGSFGQGADARVIQGEGLAGGGGGWYGGQSSSCKYSNSGAGGGSGYYATSNIGNFEIVTNSAYTGTQRTRGDINGYCVITTISTHTHSYTSSITTQPTCTAKGIKTFTCSCGDSYTEDVAALGHAWPTNYSYATNNSIANGLKYKNCTRCGTRLESLYLVQLTKGTGISTVSGSGVYKASGASVIIDATVKSGYTWKNWTGYTTTTTKNYTFTMPAKAVAFTANATANTNTPYKVEHYQQNINDNNYTLKETEPKIGTTDTQVTPAVKTYTGFTSPSTQTVNINGDGSTVVKYYYTRNSYPLTINIGTGISAVSGAGSKKYGSSVTIDATVKSGYTWKNWTGTYTYTTKNQTFTMPASNVTLTANATANTYYVQYTKGLTNGGGTTATTAHTYDADVTLASNGFEGRGYLISFNGNKPTGTIGTVQSLPSMQTGRLTFNKWSVDATYNSGTYAAATNLGKKNFESTQGARATATAHWNNKTITWSNPTLIGYDFAGWKNSAGTKLAENKLVVSPAITQYTETLTATWIPRDDTKYTVKHWVQNIDADSDVHNDTNFTLVVEDTEYLQGTSDTYVTPKVKSYEGCSSPEAITIKIEADGSTVVNYYYERIKLTLDIDGEYLQEHFPDTNGLATFDVYINNMQVANDVHDYFNDKILYGSDWKIADINPDAGKHYSGSDIKTESQVVTN